MPEESKQHDMSFANVPFFALVLLKLTEAAEKTKKKLQDILSTGKVHAVNIDNLKTNFVCMGITALQQTEN